MNNEPVAWMHQNPDYPISKHRSLEYNIPLYTHPISKAKDRFPNYESICLQCGTTIYKPAFNTLTDEEMKDPIQEYWGDVHIVDPDGFLHEIAFIKAILRKAQEK